MKVTEKDLIGDIKDFPIEIVQRMVECQVEQGNDADVSVFQKSLRAFDLLKGFSWCKSKEDDVFWNDVIMFENFDLFFQRYPKKESKPYPKVMLVWNEGWDNEKPVQRVVFMDKNGKYISWCAKTFEDAEDTLKTQSWDFAQDIPELPEKVIIKEKGIEVGGVELSIEELENILNKLKKNDNGTN